MRRAFSAESEKVGKLHCLAFVDHLNIEASRQLEEDLKGCLSKGPHYFFYFFCALPTFFFYSKKKGEKKWGFV
jgi:hypothetical protein